LKIDEEELRRRQTASQRAFYRAMASGSPGASLLELQGVQATLVPVREWFSIFNSVFYDDPGDLERAHAVLTRAYDAAGMKAWAVWVPPDELRAASLLQRRGHALDSTPMLFAAPIDALDLQPRIELDLDLDPTWELVARVNDRAHGVLESWTMAAVFSTMRDPASHLYVARRNSEAIGALIAREHEGDCYFWFVATVPEAQRSGTASELMRHGLREARRRGCTTSTLESTLVAETMYRRLGYGALGRYEMWEARST
jgi:ribosomal protein S18 acetylase RimI-like enzyme